MHGTNTAPAAVPSLLSCPRPWLVGVLHLPALPGAPAAQRPVTEIARRASEDARQLEACGFTAILIENFHDVPFRPRRVDAETIASMAVVTGAVSEAVSIPVGVNVLRNDGLAALAVAASAGGSFIRVNVLSGAAVTDQGLVEGEADELLRRRAALGAEIAILADVDVKHATSLDGRALDVRARELVGRAGADAVLVTGVATGHPVDRDALLAVRDAVAPCPVLAASGTTAEDLRSVLACCDGTIVGTALEDPDTGEFCRERAAAYVEAQHP